MSCIIPPTIQNPFLHNKVVSELQTDLANLSWLDNIFPLCKIVEIDSANGRIFVPVVYGQNADKNYIKMFPDNKERSGCFFYIGRPGILDRETREFTYEIDVIFWANLRKIAQRDWDFTDELISQAMQVFDVGNMSSDILSMEFFTKTDEVFDAFGYDVQQFKQFMFPQTAFKLRLQITVNEQLGCVTTDFGSSTSSEC